MDKHKKHKPGKWLMMTAGIIAAGLLFVIPKPEPVYAYTGFSAVSDVVENDVSVARYGLFNVTYDAGTGTGSMAGLSQKSYRDDIPLSNTGFTKTGYHFDGWEASYTDISGSGQTERIAGTVSSQKFDDVKDSSTLTLTAQWAANTYTVKFDGNMVSGTQQVTGSMEDETFTYDTRKALTTNGFTKTGYTFDSWNTKADGSGTSYDNGIVVENLATGASGNTSVTLYAQWDINTYTISYSSGVQSGSVSTSVTNSNVKSYTVETSDITLSAPSRKGYTFTGWTGSNGTTPQTSVTIQKGSTGDKSYTANWKVIDYTITYDLDGHGNVDDKSKFPESYTIEQKISIGYPDGLVNGADHTVSPIMFFTGWKGTGINEGDSSITIAKGSTGNKTYTATWNSGGLRVRRVYVLMDAAGNPTTVVRSADDVYAHPGDTVKASDMPALSGEITYYDRENGKTKDAEVTVGGENTVYRFCDVLYESHVYTEDSYGVSSTITCDLKYYNSKTGERIYPSDYPTTFTQSTNVGYFATYGPDYMTMDNIVVKDSSSNTPSRVQIYDPTHTMSYTKKDGKFVLNSDKAGAWHPEIYWYPARYKEGRLTCQISRMQWNSANHSWTTTHVWNTSTTELTNYFNNNVDTMTFTYGSTTKNKADFVSYITAYTSTIPIGTTLTFNKNNIHLKSTENFVITWLDLVLNGTNVHLSSDSTEVSYTMQESDAVQLIIYEDMNGYAVRFHPNGGYGSMDAQFISKEDGADRKLTENNGQIYSDSDDMYFAGWARSADATEPEYTDGQVMPANLALAGRTVELYAVWKQRSQGAKAFRSVRNYSIFNTNQNSAK